MSVVARRYYLRGREALRRSDNDEAARELDAALQLSPSFVEARIAHAIALQRSGDHPRAAQSLRSGLQRTTRAPERRPLLVALADVLLDLGDTDGAARALAEAAQLPGALPKLADRLARLHARTGRYSEALAALLDAARGR